MNANTWIRQTHRWVSAAFVVIVLITWATLANKGPMWVSYTPLIPLAFLALSGVYMFFLPYFGRLRSDRPAITDLEA